MIKYNYFILLILIFSMSCGKKTSGNIGIIDLSAAYEKEDKIVLLDDIADSVEAIFLETNDDILIDKITNISLYKEMLYIAHGGICSVFDISGKYKGRIGNKGNAPGEYTSIGNFIFSNDSIFIFDYRSNKIHKYLLDGKYLGTIAVPDKVQNVVHLKDDILVGYIANIMGEEVNRMVFFNTAGEVIDTIPQHKKTEGVIVYSWYAQECSFFRFNNDLYLKGGFNDTVFSISGNKMIPEYILYAGKDAITEEMRWQKVDMPKNQAKMAVPLFENSEFLFVHGMGLRFRRLIIFDKQRNIAEQVVLHYNEEFASQFNKEERDLFVPGTAVVLPDEDGTPTFRARYVSQDGKTLIGYETPAANEEDNPAVVLVHMKE